MAQDDQTRPTALSDDALDEASGGFEAWPAKWKGFSLNGKGNSALEITADQKTIIGGFKSMSGSS